jgi:hypothetical protein
MTWITYALDFRGRLTGVRPGIFELSGTTPEDAVLLAERSMRGESAFDEAGTISLGPGGAMHFHSCAPGFVASAADARRQHGAAMCAVDGGEGSLAGATGLMTSIFVLSPRGEIADTRIALLFVPGGDAGKDVR